MLEIDEQNHTSVLISSLGKIYNKGKIKGKLKAINLYLLNVVYKLLDGCCLTLSNTERRALMDIYRKIYFNSEDVCKITSIPKYQIQPTVRFFQAEVTDCNTYPKYANIYYWQEAEYATTYTNVRANALTTSFLEGKLSDTYTSFQTGKTIPYSNIGRICFLAMESDDKDFTVTDILNNVVNDSFDISYITSLNATLFVTKNVYSYGDIFFKFTKLSTGTEGNFTTQFDNTFN